MATVIATLGDDVSTDVIYPGRFMATVLPSETPQHAFADDPGLSGRLKAKSVPPGSVIVAGRNFGCGSSREQACSCLKGHELVIVARGFALVAVAANHDHSRPARRQSLRRDFTDAGIGAGHQTGFLIHSFIFHFPYSVCHLSLRGARRARNGI